MPIDCFDKHAPRELVERFNERVRAANAIENEAMQREIGMELVNEFHKEIHSELNALKKSIGLKQDEYKELSASEKIKKVNEEYDTLIANKKTELENAIQEPSTSSLLQYPQEEIGATRSERGRMEQGEQREIPAKEGKGKGEEKEMTGIKIAATAEVRKKYGLGEYEGKKYTNEELEAKADEAIKKGYNPEQLISQLEEGIPPTGIENKILKKYVASLQAVHDANPTPETLAPIERVVKALDRIGTLQSEAFATRKGWEAIDDSLAGFFIAEKEASKVDTLTKEQEKIVKQEYENISKAKKEFEEYVAKKEAEIAAKEAASEVEKTKRTTAKPKTKKTHDDYIKERASITESIKDKLKKARGNTNVTIVPYANELIAIAPDVAKLMKSYVEEGVSELGEIVKKIHVQLKDDIDGITEKDVQDIIAGKYNEKKQTRNEIAATLRDLRDEAKLIAQLEQLENGVEPKAEKKKIERNQKITALKEKIKSLKDPSVRLESAKTRIKNQIAKLEEKIKKGDFEKSPPKPPLKMDKEGLELKDKLVKLELDRKIRLLKQQYANRTKGEKIRDVVTEVANVPRAVMSSVDLSAPLRQGLWGVTSELTKLPIGQNKGFRSQRQLAAQFKDMFLSAGSQKRFDRWFYDIKETELFPIAEKSGLYIANPHDPVLSAKEEQFMSNLAEKIPFLGRAIKIPGTQRKVGGLIKGSERAYMTFLNKMRWDMFSNMVESFQANGKTIENSPKLYKAAANYVNAGTGRGSLGVLEKNAQLLNSTFFSPRLIASRLKLMTMQPLWSSKFPKELKLAYLKDLARFVSTGVIVLGLAKLNGAEVEDDLRSSDFGKMKFGDTRYDIWGGFQQYVRFLAQSLSQRRKTTTTGEVQRLNAEQLGKNALTFGRSKLAPVPSMAVDLYYREDVTGKPVTTEDMLLGMLPMTPKDTYEAMQDEGVKALFTQGLPAAFGIGVQTYNNTSDLNEILSRAMNSRNLDANKFIAYNEDGTERKATDKEAEKYMETRDKKIEEGLKEFFKKGIAVVENGEAVSKPFKELTPKQVQEEIERIKRRATTETKKEVFPEPEIHKREKSREQKVLERYKKHQQ